MQAKEKSRQVVRHRSTEDTPRYYANNAEIRGTQWDIRIILGEILDATEDRLEVKDLAYVYMSPQHAKAFANALMKTIKQHEEAVGPIMVFDQQDTTNDMIKTAKRKK